MTVVVRPSRQIRKEERAPKDVSSTSPTRDNSNYHILIIGQAGTVNLRNDYSILILYFDVSLDQIKRSIPLAPESGTGMPNRGHEEGGPNVVLFFVVPYFEIASFDSD